MRTSETLNELAKAMSEFQGKVKSVPKKSANPYFKSSYSDLTAILECVRPTMSECGLFFVQDAQTTSTGVSVTTMIGHVSGQWMETGPFEVVVSKRDAHAIGSAASYARRYAIIAALGICSTDEDDDGNQAVQNYSETAAKPKDDKIPCKWANSIADRLAAHDDLRAELLSLCGVGCIADIKVSQQPTVKKFMETKNL